MSVLALIPARGGSKSVPRKNLAMLAGRPLIAHSIAHALASGEVNRTIVSTEDEEIAAVARAHGAETPFMRPPGLAGDEVLDLPVFLHALDWLAQHEGWVPELIVHLRPTAPHRRPGWIDAAIAALRARPDAHALRSVSMPAQHPWRVFRIDGDGLLDPVMKHEHPVPYLPRRQDLPAMYYYNCVIDVTRPSTVRELGSTTGTRLLPWVMDPDEVVDIDSPRDLRIARCLLEHPA